MSEQRNSQPLAARMRPSGLEDYLGQTHILAHGKPLREALDSGQLHSMILWGPPGVGKTTLAQLIATLCDARFISLSATLAGVKDVRAAVEEAKAERQYGRQTVLFIDEVHRFNKAQQDAFLPFVEDGTVIFVGATTENPSFELNNALLSRARVYQLESLSEEVLQKIVRNALNSQGYRSADEWIEKVASYADGDARKALNILDVAMDMAWSAGNEDELTANVMQEALSNQPKRFDKGGDAFYEQISALHKAVRGSSPDGALYWYARMIDGGCDPLYVARRVVRMASEDIGNADPRALRIALDAWDVQERLGSPEGELAIAQAVVYCASAAKSNAVYSAYNAVRAAIKSGKDYDVPMHLRNAPTKMMKGQGYGEDYRYAHNEPNAYAAGENYLPEPISGEQWYYPVPRGMEIKIAEKLGYLKSLDDSASKKRYKG